MAKKSEDKEPELAPIIIKKIQAGHGGAHGGAWKIALADMMTAMMAFFLLMWLLGATNEHRGLLQAHAEEHRGSGQRLRL
jgi:chemotaxis protein MotB